jgi:hypothetical protein
MKAEGGRRTAMIHDLSVTGASLVVAAKLTPGDIVSLQLYATGDPTASSRVTRARVVRVEPLDPASRSLWSHRVAVQFDENLEDFEPEIRALAERQRQLGVQR